MAASNQRAKSALTRHTGRLENEFSENELASRVSSSRRVQSARERKMSQESSHVFPSELYSPSVGGDRWKTMYSEDYESKASTRPSSARPTSPTRRNNPHPRQSFMTWRIPARQLSMDDEGIDGDVLKSKLQEFEVDVAETFQKDYKDSRNDGDAHNEVLTTLAKLPLQTPDPESWEYGRRLSQPSPGKLPAMPKRIEVQPATDEIDLIESKPKTKAKVDKIKIPVTQQTLETAVKSEHLPAVDDWLKNANKREQHAVLSMLKSAEDAQIDRAVSRTLQPHTIPAVQQWLKEAKPEDRTVAVRLLNAISPPSSARPPSRAQVRRRASVSVDLVPKVSSQAAAKQLYRRHSMPERANAPRNKQPAALWHLDPFRNQRPTGVHRESVFGSAPKFRGSHYVIHPEWPEYV